LSKLKLLMVILCVASLLLGACGGAATPTAQTQDPQAVFTAAAQTAQARMTEMAAVTPTQPATPTFTVEPTQAVTLTATSPLTPTLPLTGTVTVTGTQQVSGTDKLEFVRDVTVPDGTQFKPGEAFVKTWQLKNTGTSTWTPQYALVYSSGEQMGAPASIPLSGNTPPGGTADVSVNLTAPQTPGSYFGFWMLRGPSGRPFGVGANGDQPFYVQIIVGESSTGGSTTPGPSGDTVTDVTMVVDNAAVEGGCPHTFYFVGRFVLNKAATVTYEMEADTGFELTLPAPTTAPLDAGVHTVTYTLDFADSVEGSAAFHVTSPDDVQSAPVNFTLTCD
jgi:hypothetical protein